MHVAGWAGTQYAHPNLAGAGLRLTVAVAGGGAVLVRKRGKGGLALLAAVQHKHHDQQAGHHRHNGAHDRAHVDAAAAARRRAVCGNGGGRTGRGAGEPKGHHVTAAHAVDLRAAVGEAVGEWGGAMRLEVSTGSAGGGWPIYLIPHARHAP